MGFQAVSSTPVQQDGLAIGVSAVSLLPERQAPGSERGDGGFTVVDRSAGGEDHLPYSLPATPDALSQPLPLHVDGPGVASADVKGIDQFLLLQNMDLGGSVICAVSSPWSQYGTFILSHLWGLR